jgi:hypothetical protein
MIPAKTHDRDTFYKYRTAADTIGIISNLQVCCSSPILFNDPFDTLIELRFGFDPSQTVKFFWEKYQKIIHGIVEYDCPNTTKLGWLINHFKENPGKVGPYVPFESVSSEFWDLDLKTTAERFLEESNQVWLEFLRNERIFCMSEMYDEILMWSHYADHHRGAVIEFKCLPDLDRAFNVASKVNYTATKPKLGTFDQWFDHSCGKKLIDNWDLSNQYSFTKSYHWQYEKEWRFALKKTSSDDALYEFRPILPEELSAVYLGCRILEDDKNEILQVIKRFLPQMRVHQAFMDKDEYKLHFERIL